MNERTLSTDRPIEIYYALLSDVTSFRKLSAVTCEVTLKKDWQLIHTTIGTIYLKETLDETRAGTLFLTELTASCPGHDPDIAETISFTSGKKVLIKAVFRGGLEKIVGNANSGPKLFFEVNSHNNTERNLKAGWESDWHNLYHV